MRKLRELTVLCLLYNSALIVLGFVSSDSLVFNLSPPPPTPHPLPPRPLFFLFFWFAPTDTCTEAPPTMALERTRGITLGIGK